MMIRTMLAMATAAALTCSAATAGPEPDEKSLEKIAQATPDKASAKPASPRKMLILSYRSHRPGRLAGEAFLKLLAERTDIYEPTFVRDEKKLPEVMVPENLKQYDAVCVNNSTGGGGKASNGKTLVENLAQYVRGGGGLVGIHSATDNKFGEVFGGYFTGHPWNQEVGVRIDDPDHRLTKVFAGEGFAVHDEIYQFAKIYTRDNLRVLLTLDMDRTPDKGKRKDKDYAVAWVRQFGKGRVFYCSLGHRPAVFHRPKLLKFYADGIQFALGDIEADTTPSAKLAKGASGK